MYCCFLLMIFAPMVHAVTLHDAFQKSLSATLAVPSSEMGVLAAEESLAAAKKGWFPTLNMQATGGTTLSNQAGMVPHQGDFYNNGQSNNTGLTLRMNQNLYSGGKTVAAIAQSKKAVEQALVGNQNVLQSVFLAVVQAYGDLIRARAMHEIAINNLKVYEHSLLEVKARYDAGEETMASVAAIESKLENAKAGLIERQMQLKNAESAYLLVVGETPPPVLEKPTLPSQLPNSLEEALKIALKNNLSIHQKDIEAAQYKYHVDEVESAFYPSVDATVTASRSLSSTVGSPTQMLPGHRRTRENQVGMLLTASVPLDVFGTVQANTRASRYQAAKKRLDALQERRDEMNKVIIAWNNFINSAAIISKLQAQIRSAEIGLKNANEEFKVGYITYLAVIEAGQNLLDAQNQLASVERDRLVSAYQLMAETGLLEPAKMGLTLHQNLEAQESPWGMSIPELKQLDGNPDPVVVQYKKEAKNG